MKKAILLLTTVLIICVLSVTLLGCQTRLVNQTNYNIKQAADNFTVYRRMTFINLRTDKILYQAEGYFSLQDSRKDGSEISLTFKIAEDEYKLDYFSVDANVAYVIEQVENTTTDPYHWHIYWYIPKVDVVNMNE